MTKAERFATFHTANPHVYTLFKRFAFEAIEAGRTKLSSQLIIERIRWEASVVTKRTDGYKINDHYKPFYSRMFMSEYPEFSGFFETRERRSA
jgi:hypothetical protein